MNGPNQFSLRVAVRLIASHQSRKIQSELVSLGLRDCRNHAQSYTILRETRMPAVLIEPVFISNDDEAKRIQDPEFLADVADAIVSGVRRYHRTFATLLNGLIDAGLTVQRVIAIATR